jgi:hypothetical protein
VALPSDRLVALRRCALAVTVLGGVELVPDDRGVELAGLVAIHVPWEEIDAVVGTIDADSAHARRRLGHWLALRRAVVDHFDLDDRARPVGLPRRHVLHPGPEWVRFSVPGDAIDVGLGFVGLLHDPDEVVIMPPGVLAASDIDASPWWPAQVKYLERMAAVAAQRLHLRPDAPLRPMGDCDVITLLASQTFRTALCLQESSQLRSAAVPMRQRGWLDLSRIDPAFAMAAAAATEPAERGFDRVVLISQYEVALAADGGRVSHWSLHDPPPREVHGWSDGWAFGWGL